MNYLCIPILLLLTCFGTLQASERHYQFTKQEITTVSSAININARVFKLKFNTLLNNVKELAKLKPLMMPIFQSNIRN